ncbi:hypothetical protein [Paenibacillus sp. MMS18-CY102]|uniref:hypothetical protein n=1 Tax=Paenibacillus sp. MMS18-CY102 TaxID=2682849 RepID=UPI001365C624|nr:hypothetical protein [Paenibacillus sp. MMS18-CY102]MWC29226.1 hypothetical protein [Paenibacillus sp. MMS18-CY102]
MFFFKKNKSLTEQDLRALVEGLEQAYMNKDEQGLTARFHPSKRGITFLNHFQLMLNFQIYHIQSEMLGFELLELDGARAVFTYTRKHMHTCLNPADEREEKQDHIKSFYVEAVKENGSIWITRYSPYSLIYVDKKGEPLAGVDAAIPPGEELNPGIARYIPYFQLDGYMPATLHVYSNSQYIGFYPQGESGRYRTSRTFSIDYYDKLEAASVKEHTEDYISHEIIVAAEVLHQAERSSIIETQYMKNNALEHELVASLLAEDGFYMIRYLYKTGELLPSGEREKWMREMLAMLAAV